MTLTTADLPSTSVENEAMSPRSGQSKRRSFTAQYKLDILAEYEAADLATRGVVLRPGFKGGHRASPPTAGISRGQRWLSPAERLGKLAANAASCRWGAQ